jgi:hypothetical protein
MLQVERLMRHSRFLVVLAVLMTILVSASVIAEDRPMVGKKVDWEAWAAAPKPETAPSMEGEALETPNQRRRRLGLPIEASFASHDCGVAEETPNQRRRRLGSAPDFVKADRPMIENILNQ